MRDSVSVLNVLFGVNGCNFSKTRILKAVTFCLRLYSFWGNLSDRFYNIYLIRIAMSMKHRRLISVYRFFLNV